MDINPRIIPITKLRNLYEFFKDLDVSSHEAILENYLNNPKKLTNLWGKSLLHFERYNNDEEFIPKNNLRKNLTENENLELTNTPICISKMKKQVDFIIQTNKEYNFKFIDYELSPIRTTKSKFEDGKMGTSSGIGGVDFFGINKSQSMI